jgi:hypothetical protein
MLKDLLERSLVVVVEEVETLQKSNYCCSKGWP